MKHRFLFWVDIGRRKPAREPIDHAAIPAKFLLTAIVITAEQGRGLETGYFAAPPASADVVGLAVFRRRIAGRHTATAIARDETVSDAGGDIAISASDIEDLALGA